MRQKQLALLNTKSSVEAVLADVLVYAVIVIVLLLLLLPIFPIYLTALLILSISSRSCVEFVSAGLSCQGISAMAQQVATASPPTTAPQFVQSCDGLMLLSQLRLFAFSRTSACPAVRAHALHWHKCSFTHPLPPRRPPPRPT